MLPSRVLLASFGCQKQMGSCLRAGGLGPAVILLAALGNAIFMPSTCLCSFWIMAVLDPGKAPEFK